MEGCAAVKFALRPHSASMLLNDALHSRQTYARTFKVFRAVQSLKDPKQLVNVFHVEAEAVVSDHEHRFSMLAFIGDFDDGMGTGTGEL